MLFAQKLVMVEREGSLRLRDIQILNKTRTMTVGLTRAEYQETCRSMLLKIVSNMANNHFPHPILLLSLLPNCKARE